MWTFVYKEVLICTCTAVKADWNITQILLFLDDLLMFYQAFGVNLMWYFCCLGGAGAAIRDCASIGTYTVDR